MSELQEQIKEKRREKWFELWFTIEALAVTKETVESALKKHVEKMEKVKNVLVYETDYGETIRVEKPMKNVEEGYSQYVKVRLFVKDLPMLISVVMTYGPSAVEVLGPEKKELNISEVQNIVNLLAGILHQFAAAGVGGIIITPDK